MTPPRHFKCREFTRRWTNDVSTTLHQSSSVPTPATTHRGMVPKDFPTGHPLWNPKCRDQVWETSMIKNHHRSKHFWRVLLVLRFSTVMTHIITTISTLAGRQQVSLTKHILKYHNQSEGFFENKMIKLMVLFANSWWFDGHFTWLLWDITTYHGTVLLCFKRPGTQKLCRIAPKKSLQTSPCVEKLRAAPPWPIWHWLHLGDLWVIIGFRELNGFDGSQEIPLFVARKCGFLPIVHIIIQWVIALVVWLTQLSLSPKGPCKKVLPGTGYLLASAPGWITTHRVVLILRGLGLLGPAEKVEDMNDWKRLVRMCGNASRASWSLVPKFIKILKFAFDHVCFMSVSILKPGCPALLPTSTINFSPRNGCCRWTISSCSGHPEDRCRLGRFPCFPVLPLFLVRGRLCHGVPMVRWGDVMTRHCCSVSCSDGPDGVAERKYPQMSTAVPSMWVVPSRKVVSNQVESLLFKFKCVFPKQVVHTEGFVR